jgi:quercetin dioxygenase-like cupin family protein
LGVKGTIVSASPEWIIERYKMYIGTKENAPHCEMPEPYKRTLRVLLSPELDPTQKDIAAGMVELPSHSQSDWRGHEEGEMFFCISGAGRAKIGEEMITLKPFSAVYVPPFVPHQTYNDSDSEDLVLLFVLTPPFGGDRSIIERYKSQTKKEGK